VPTRKTAGRGFNLTVQYPEAGWYAASGVVPNLYSPHELCVMSNRPLRKVPLTSDQNHPDINALGNTGCLIWVYYEVLGEVLGNPVTPDPERPPIPDYSRYSYPLAYSESQVFPPQLGYDWSSNVLWRRLGHNLAPTAQRPEPAALTVMIWEGNRAAADDLHAVEAVVRSVSVS
jgi:hypothetical protein